MMFKIQVAATNEGAIVQAPPELTQWADMEDLPPFSSIQEAEQWMVDNGTQQLERYGLKFRVVGAAEQEGSLPAVEIVGAEEIDPDVLQDLETQLLAGGLDSEGNPRIMLSLDQDITELVDEETLEMLDADWDEAKQ